MRIAFFTDTFPPEVNGAANTAERAARALGKRGHDVRVFTVSKHSEDELQGVAGGDYRVEVIPSVGLPIYLGVRATLPFGVALRRVGRFKPDILHAHTPFSMGLEAVWAARFGHVPLVGTHHTFFNHYLRHIHLDFAWAERLSWKLTVAYYNRCDLVVSPTRSLVEELQTNGLKRPFEIVPNFVDTALFCPPAHKAAAKERLGLSPHVVIHMGRLSYEKSVDQALQVFARIAASDADATMVIAGDGPGKADLESLAHQLGLADRVRFTGFIYGEELVSYLQAADVFLTASKSENMPLAVLEAMAASLPIVAVRSLGLTEIIEDGKNGHLVAPDDIEGMAAHVRELLTDETKRAAFAARSRALTDRYSEPAITARFEALYARLASHAL